VLENYLPVLIFLAIGLLFGIGPMVAGFADVRYYLVAILFIIFDLEIAFLFPWAIVLEDLGPQQLFAMIAMGIFLLILVVGFIYEWKKGALEWE
jgi:NADH-quinone oxidoreductase subunit A